METHKDPAELKDFIKLIQKLNKSEQLGVLLMIQGAKIIKGDKP